MFLAPMPSVLAARRAGTLGELNPLPFPSLIGNCVAWIAYGLVVKAPPIPSPTPTLLTAIPPPFPRLNPAPVLSASHGQSGPLA